MHLLNWIYGTCIGSFFTDKPLKPTTPAALKPLRQQDITRYTQVRNYCSLREEYYTQKPRGIKAFVSNPVPFAGECRVPYIFSVLRKKNVP